MKIFPRKRIHKMKNVVEVSLFDYITKLKSCLKNKRHFVHAHLGGKIQIYIRLDMAPN